MKNKGRSLQKVLLIGWDAADWKIITPLLDAGKMPHLADLIRNGVRGNMATMYPPLSPMLWTSIATGQRPFRHGVLGFREPDPLSGSVRPISVLSRKTKAVWNILNQNDKQSVVVGWWPSHPAEPIHGGMVSDRYAKAYAPLGAPWPLRRGTVHPRRLTGKLMKLRQHPGNVDYGLIRQFVKQADALAPDKDPRIRILAQTIAECTSICNAAQDILQRKAWDFAAVFFDSLDHFCHCFMQYYPPRLSWVSDTDFALFNNVIEQAYIYHDMLLGRLLAETDESTSLFLVSDHGFHSDKLRPQYLSSEPAGPVAQHRHLGIFVARGPDLKKGARIHGTSLLDVCPTILALFGLPMGEDMDGKPLLHIFKTPPELQTIPSWENIPGNDGRHPADSRVDTADTAAALRQLVALGYIEELPEDKQKAIEDTVSEQTYNLACSYMEAFRFAEAAPILEKLLAQNPDEHHIAMALADCRFALGHIRRARTLVDSLIRTGAQKRRSIREKLQQLQAQLQETGRKQQDEEKLRQLQAHIRRLQAGARMHTYTLEFLMGCACHAEGREEQALKHLSRAQDADSSQIPLFLKLGELHLRMRQADKARQAFEQALELDPDNAPAFMGMARVHLHYRQNHKAAEAALHSVSLVFHNPKGHFILAIALFKLGYIPKAIHALQLATAQNHNFVKAWYLLTFLYKQSLDAQANIQECHENARKALKRLKAIRNHEQEDLPDIVKQEELRASATLTSDLSRLEPVLSASFDTDIDLKHTAVIVSGLPRSGTSMMMQMLEAGGIPVLSDKHRQADSSNINGYYEHDSAKSPAAFPALLAQGNGKAVKIVVQLLPQLPHLPGTSYRVILMQRTLDEVLASQHAMLQRNHMNENAISDKDLAAVYSRQMRQVQRQLASQKIPFFMVNYNETICDPMTTAEKVSAFLGFSLDVQHAAAIVNAKLYRERTGLLRIRHA